MWLTAPWLYLETTGPNLSGTDHSFQSSHPWNPGTIIQQRVYTKYYGFILDHHHLPRQRLFLIELGQLGEKVFVSGTARVWDITKVRGDSVAPIHRKAVLISVPGPVPGCDNSKMEIQFWPQASLGRRKPAYAWIVIYDPISHTLPLWVHTLALLRIIPGSFESFF
jgi:hypothetical protein